MQRGQLLNSNWLLLAELIRQHAIVLAQVTTYHKVRAHSTRAACADMQSNAFALVLCQAPTTCPVSSCVLLRSGDLPRLAYYGLATNFVTYLTHIMGVDAATAAIEVRLASQPGNTKAAAPGLTWEAETVAAAGGAVSPCHASSWVVGMHWRAPCSSSCGSLSCYVAVAAAKNHLPSQPSSVVDIRSHMPR